MLWMALPDTVPLSLLTAIARLLLNELVKFAVAVLPLAAAALPYPLMSWSVWFLELVLVDVRVDVLVDVSVAVLVEE